MDSSPNQTAAGDLSGQLELYPINTDGGPINQMPNEIMALILDKLKLAGDNDDDDDVDMDKDGDGYVEDIKDDDGEGKAKEVDDGKAKDIVNIIEDDEDGDYYYDANMVKLRLVSKKWNSLVEDFCRKKKVLSVNGIIFSNPALNNSVPLLVKLKNVDFFGSILKLFPNVVQLAVGFSTHLDDTQIHNFAVKIDSMSSLKLLKLEGHILAALPHLPKTLSKLKHIEVDSDLCFFTKDHWLRFVSCLGPDCSVSVHLDEYNELNYNDLLQWHNNNAHFFANLTHLRGFFHGDSEDCAKVVHFLCEHATSLEFLAFYAWTDHLEMSPTLIRDLVKLVHLTELKLWGIAIDIPALEEAAVQQYGLTSLSSILICKLYIESGRPKTADKFIRVLSAIFPNLIKLHLDIDDEFSTSRSFLRQVRQNLNQFPNLRKRRVVY